MEKITIVIISTGQKNIELKPKKYKLLIDET